MLHNVRTNIDIENWLWEKARKVAVRRRVSLAYLVNVAIRDYLGLKQPLEPKRPGRPRIAKKEAKP